MGFNKCILPSIEIMQSELDRIGLAEFVRIYTKYDSIMGETDRMEFLESKINLYENLQTGNYNLINSFN